MVYKKSLTNRLSTPTLTFRQSNVIDSEMCRNDFLHDRPITRGEQGAMFRLIAVVVSPIRCRGWGLESGNQNAFSVGKSIEGQKVL